MYEFPRTALQAPEIRKAWNNRGLFFHSSRSYKSEIKVSEEGHALSEGPREGNFLVSS